MKKIWYMLFGLCIIQNRTTALNIECLHESIQSAIKESASLAAYQTAWQDISKVYTLELIITYMQELQSDVPVTEQ
mgnify:FL=1